MKTIGLVGGMSWESSIIYYQVVNQVVNKELGGLHSAKCLMCSVDFQEIEECQEKGEWEKSGEILADAAASLERAGADFIIICTNTMHKVIKRIQSKVHIPILHIADALTEKLKEDNVKKVALLGTKYTMTQDFYKDKLSESGIEVVIPDEKDMETVNAIIYDELCLGVMKEESKKEYIRIIEKLSKDGIEAIVLGCTEIGMLIKQEDIKLPLYDTTYIHAIKAALRAVDK